MESIELPPSVSTLPPAVGSESVSTSLQDVEAMSVDLPPDVGSDTDMSSTEGPNCLDDEQETDAEEADLNSELASLHVAPCKVPLPDEAAQMCGKHAFAEFYSPPRTAPILRAAGLTALLSLDILTGWDFQNLDQRQLAIRLLTTLSIMFLVVCPPCRAFSELQRLWNFKRMTKEKQQQLMSEGMTYLEHAMQAVQEQLRRRRFFMFEHPARASSWNTPAVRAVLAEPEVQVITVDMCVFGLRSKVNQIPMRKRTKIMTNSKILAKRLQNCLCKGGHQHQTIQGQEGGVRRSTWAQIYPQGFVDILAVTAFEHNSGSTE
eukprot:s3646_g4.t1